MPTSGAKTVLAWINVLSNNSTAAATVDILASSSVTLPDPLVGNTFWPSVSTITITAGTTGVFKSSVITTVADWAKHKISGLNASICYEIILYLYDT